MAITFFKDLPLDFTPHPVTGDIRPVTNETAIKRSIRNLLMTKKGSKPFNPDYGSNISDYLFTQLSGFSSYDLKESIFETLLKYEPRINVEDVMIRELYNDGIEIVVQYIVKNVGRRDTFVTSVKRTA